MREIDQKAVSAYERLAEHDMPLDPFEQDLLERDRRGEIKHYTMDDHDNMIDDDPSIPDPDDDD